MHKGVPFTISILTLMLCIVGFLSASLLIVGWRSTRALEEASIDLHMASLDEAVTDWLAATLQASIFTQLALARTPTFLAKAEDFDEAELVRQLAALLADHVDVAAAHVGFADGRFVHVGRIGLDVLPSGAMPVPGDAALRVRSIRNIGAERVETSYFILADGRHSASESRPSAFDPRSRPWYQQAIAAHGPIMTEPYDFAFTPIPGISIATPIGRERGVVAFDFTLENLSRVAARHKVSPGSIVMVTTEAGNLLADTSSCSGCEHGSPDAVDLLRRDLLDATHRGAGRLDIKHTAGGRDWEMLIDPVPALLRGRFFIGAAAPVAEITIQSGLLIREAVTIALVVVLFAVAAVLFAALALSKGIKRVAARTSGIRDLDFTAGEPVRSRIREIMLLSDTMERVRDGLEIFGRYVAKDLVRQIMRSPSAAGVGGQRREMTVMFSDIEGFSRISESIAPEVLTGRLSRYFDALAVPIAASKGTIDKFIGDSIMAFWNAPELDERHVEHACRAALRAAAASRHLAEKWSARGRPVFRTRFGLHTGLAVIGNVGARDRINYTLVGSLANQASRLEGLNKIYGTEILATGIVAETTAAILVWRHIDRVVPAGTSEALDLFELLGDVADARDTAFLELWNDARRAYVVGDFAGAIAKFEVAARQRPGDGPCRIMLDRCRSLLPDGPPSDWTGVWHFDTK